MEEARFPLLAADEIECRTQSVGESNGKVEAVILLYITARAAMDRLDARFGMTGWQRHNREIKGNLFCEISVWDAEKGWIGKEDVGTESNMEAVKGESSDAFKRSAVNWGIGRELYTAPQIKIPLGPKEFRQKGNGKFDCYAHFDVGEIAYTDGKIAKLVLTKWGDVRYTYEAGKRPVVAPVESAANYTQRPAESRAAAAPASASNYTPQPAGPRTAQQATPDKCPLCGGQISAAEISFSQRRFGKIACKDCQKRLKA